MAITIQPYTNTTDDLHVTKSLTAIGTTLTVTIKEDTSLLNPVFIVSGDASTFAGCNYVTTTNLGGRAYFVKDIRTLSNGMTELHCHCDVLSSWKDTLLALPAIVERQEFDFNLYLDDGSFMTYANPHVVTREFTSGFSTPCYLLTLAGGKPATP